MSDKLTERDNSSIAARLAYVRKIMNLSARKFADTLTVPAGTYLDWEGGRTAPSVKALAVLIDQGWSALWLTTGRGEPRNSSEAGIDFDPSGVSASGNKSIPIYRVELSAGYGETYLDDVHVDEISFSEEFIKREFMRDTSRLHIVFARGNSMEPTISNGDMLVVDHTETWIMSGFIYAIQVRERLFVKRMRVSIAGEYTVVSDNPSFPPELLPIGQEDFECRVIGRVIWHSAHPG